MRRALLLAGGGARGAYQVGMLEELIVYQKLDFQILRGVSVGAFNAAFLAQAPSSPNSQEELAKRVGHLKDVWQTEIEGNHSIYAERAGFVGLALGVDSLYSYEPLKSLINQHISVASLQTSGRDFAVGVVSLVSGGYSECSPQAFPGDFMDRFLASNSIPVVFPFVDIKNKDVLVDGGVRNITPLSTVFRADPPPDEIFILLTSRFPPKVTGIPDSTAEEHDYKQWDDNWLGTAVNGIDVLKRTLDILTDEIYLDDIRTALRWNDVANAIQKLGVEGAGALEAQNALAKARKRFVKLHVIAPRIWFDETKQKGQRNSSIDFSPALIEKAIAHGRDVAKDRSQWVWETPNSA